MKLATVALAALIVLSMAGCGKRSPDPGSAPTPATTSSPAPAAVEPPAGAVPPPVVAEPSAAEQAAAAKAQKPAKQVSEMDDDVETVDDASSAAAKGPSVDIGAAEAPVAHFKEGVNYKPIVPAQPTDVAPGHVEVAEVFWYGCPHCFVLDPQIESWRQGGGTGKKPAWVDFVRIPAVWNDELRMHARLFYTLEALGRLDELHPVVFREVQVNGNKLDTADKIGAFLRAHGVTAEDFRKTFNSFSVETRLKRADLLGRRYRVQSVPLVIVNGKYASDLGMAGSPEALLSLVNELAMQEHAR